MHGGGAQIRPPAERHWRPDVQAEAAGHDDSPDQTPSRKALETAKVLGGGLRICVPRSDPQPKGIGDPGDCAFEDAAVTDAQIRPPAERHWRLFDAWLGPVCIELGPDQTPSRKALETRSSMRWYVRFVSSPDQTPSRKALETWR